MRRLMAFCWLLMMGVPGFGQGLSRLERVKPGATVIVETTDAWGGAQLDRCKLVGADANGLTCVDVVGTQGQEVFPVKQLDAVYEIHKSHAKTVWASIGVGALLALTIGGLVSGNLGLLLLAGIFGGVWGAAATGQFPGPSPRVGPYGPVYAGAPQPWEKGESGRLVYVRRWVPTPATP